MSELARNWECDPSESATTFRADGMVLQFVDGAIASCNPVAAEILGYTTDQLIGKTLFDSPEKLIHRDGSAFLPEENPALVALRTGQPCSNVTIGFYRPDGKLVWLKLDSQPLFRAHESAPYAVVTTIADVTNDINEQKNNTTLPESQANLRLLIKYAPVCLAMFDREMNYIALSQRWVEIYQLQSVEAVLGRSHYEVFPQIGSRWRAAHQRALAGEIQQCEEDSFTLPDGTIQWLRWEIGPWHTEGGEIGGIVIFVEDISDRKQSEAALGESEHRYRTLFESMDQGFCVCEMLFDENGEPTDYRFLEVNPVFEKMTGLDSATGKTARELVPNLEAFWFETYGRVALTGEPARFENKSEVMNRWFEVSAFRIGDPQSHKFAILFTNIDFRKQAEIALQQSEERLSLAIDTAGMATWDIDVQTGKGIWSESHFPMLGYKPVANGAATFEMWRRRVHPDDLAAVMQAVEYAQQTRSLYSPEYRIVRADNGEIRWLKAFGRFLYDFTGQAVRFIGVLFDISDRKQAELALAESESRFRTLADNIAQLAWMTDENGWIFWYNQRWFDYTGTTLEEMQGWGWEKVHHPDHIERVVEHWTHSLKIGEPWEDTFPLRGKDGTYRWFLSRAIPIRDEHGLVVRWFGTNTDISDRKQTEDALLQSEERLRLALNAANQGLYDLNIQTGDAIVSPQYAQMLGYDPEHFQETNAFWLSRLHPDDLQRVSFVYSEYIAGRRDQYQVEFRQRTKSGDWKWILSTGSIVAWDRDGNPLRMLGIHTDISDRKQAEEALRQSNAILNTINESTPTLIYVKDREGRMLVANPALLAVVGKPSEAILGKTSLEFYEPLEEAEKVMENDRLVMQTGQSHQFEEVLDMVGGRRVYLSVKAPYRDEQGNIIGIIGISSDISDRKIAELELERLYQAEQQARQEAQTANRLKDEFLAVLSHELRSPLNPILGWTKLLQTRKLDPARTAEALATIERNAKLQAQLIEDLLDISRVMRGKLTLKSNRVNLNFVISSAIETVRLAAEAKNIQFNLALNPTVGEVLGDAGRLQQVVWNLLSNAVKFTPSGGQVTIKLTQVDTDAQIEIIDTGKGISPDFLPYVFEYFRQEDGSTTRKFGGLGLGLAIARQIVEMHGGRIWADSPGVGFGATFTVKLPALHTKLKPAANVAASSSLAANSTPLTKMRILVVDDTADTREFLAFLLEENGAIVLAVSSATEALQTWGEFQPDIILSDIGMPEMDGYELMRSLRGLETGRSIPAIALTAYAGEIDRQQAIAAGFQRHVAKPIEPDVVISYIVELVGARH